MAQAHGHMTAAQAGQLAARAGASRLLLTHLLAGVAAEDLLRNAETSFPGPVRLASEGYVFER
jgi:ribonuclease BN (tRNA processing enzyme)